MFKPKFKLNTKIKRKFKKSFSFEIRVLPKMKVKTAALSLLAVSKEPFGK